MSVCVECGKPMCRFEDCKFLHIGNCRYCHVEYHDDEFIPKICINIDDWIDESSQNMDLRELSMGYDAKIDWYVRYHPEKIENILELFEKMISTDIEADNLRGQSLALQKLSRILKSSSHSSNEALKEIFWRIYKVEEQQGKKKNQAMALHHLNKLILVDGVDDSEKVEFVKFQYSLESELFNDNYVEYVGKLMSFFVNSEASLKEEIRGTMMDAISKIEDDFTHDLFMTCISSLDDGQSISYGEGIESCKLNIDQSEYIFIENINLLKISSSALPNSPVNDGPTIIIDLPNVLNTLMRKRSYHDVIGAFIEFLDNNCEDNLIQIVSTFGSICEFPFLIKELINHSGVDFVMPFLPNEIPQDLTFVMLARASKKSIIVTNDRLREEQKSHPEWFEKDTIRSLKKFKVTKRRFEIF